MRFRRQVYKILSYKDGCIWKTQFLCWIWKDEKDPRSDEEIAKEFGGDLLAACPTNVPLNQQLDFIGKGTKKTNVP